MDCKKITEKRQTRCTKKKKGKIKERNGTSQFKTYQLKETTHYCATASSAKLGIPSVIPYKPEFW